MKPLLPCIFLFFISCQKIAFKQVQPGQENDQTLSPSSKPNIILILGDDVGYEVPSYTGGQSYETPNLDAFAAKGVQFTQCHASPLCSPSRFMLLTGKYNFRNYIQWGIMDTSQRTIANMLHDAGYKTYVAGKWQLSGGDSSIHIFGFDDYIVHNPYFLGLSEELSSRYKSPSLYKNGAYIADSLTLNKYADDIFTDSINSFIHKNARAKKPFFIYYPMDLCHPPFSPTPDDAAFPSWDPLLNISDTSFFPSMIKYMDKKIQLVIDKVNAEGIASKTIIIIILGDNGTMKDIYSTYKGMRIQGGKSQTIETGLHVPLIIYRNGYTSAQINNDLIDFTDFLPTIADIAGIPVPAKYHPIDGISFYPQITGMPGSPKKELYYWYSPRLLNDKLTIWVQDTTYKLYSTGQFYNFYNDYLETTELKNSELTGQEKLLQKSFQKIITRTH